MAVYKVIQDVEAEDKLLGPLGIRQFVYAAITGLLLFICFRLYVTPQLGIFRIIMICVLLGPAVLFGVLASPLGGTQSTETWLLSRMRFFFKPQRRVWDQMGAKNLVTITAPKRDPVRYTKDLTMSEVHSRLETLATTLDSRGWAVKDSALNDFTHPSYYSHSEENSERLVGIETLPQASLPATALPEDDILDGQSNGVAQNVDRLMQAKATERKQQILAEVGQKTPASAQSKPTIEPASVVNPDKTSQAFQEARANEQMTPEEALLEHVHKHKERIKKQRIENDHLKKVLPISEQKKLEAEENARIAAANEARIRAENEAKAQADKTRAELEAKRNAIINYMAKNSDEITPASVSAITKHKIEEEGKLHEGDEVVVSLH